MEIFTINKIRKMYLDFFKDKDHYVRESFSLVPEDDKSILLINAGMVPLKPYFSGDKKPISTKMVSCQKCIRTDDIENVGKTARHATFFEMLGNFSFGDYFKKEAIEWSWDFVLNYLKLDEDKLWVSVYEEDDEAYNIWSKDIKVSENRIVKLGKEDNFWEIGTGPCGPCSEIYYDLGHEYGCSSDSCSPGCDCDRYVEFWNLVFTQFNKTKDGKYENLPNPNIDTGMGLERIASILQDKKSIYEIDSSIKIKNEIIKYAKNTDKEISLNIITDHIKAITFLIADGIIPSNEGRGYVLRRLIRRAVRHGKLIGVEELFLNKVFKEVISVYKNNYKELEEKVDYIQKIIKIEEEKFEDTLSQGIIILEEHLKDNDIKILSGKFAFKLYDTYGFPIELTSEILEEYNIEIDIKEFEEEMKAQKERARNSRSSSDDLAWEDNPLNKLDKDFSTEYLGENETKIQSKVSYIIKDNNFEDSALKGDKVTIITDRTVFYGESGGQVGDKGILYNNDFKAEVLDTKVDKNNRIYKIIDVIEGEVKVNDIINQEIDNNRRSQIRKNHTATHLLHKALKDTLGEHVNQKGSYVDENRLRFDFNHFDKVDRETIDSIELKINNIIQSAKKLNEINTDMENAKKLGAVALFDDKYKEKVRVIEVEDVSKELCGGSHVLNTSEIGGFHIISESGIASGIRRIEAITGKEFNLLFNNLNQKLNKIGQILKVNKDNIENKVIDIIEENKEYKKEIEKLKSIMAENIVGDIINSSIEVNDSKLVIYNFGEKSMNELRNIGDKIKEKIESGIVLIASSDGGKANFVSMVTDDLIKKGCKAGDIVKFAVKFTNGGGGGRPNSAQAGGKDASQIDKSLEESEKYLLDKIK